MYQKKCQKNRWMAAVAVTCLSGFALCGCTRGSHGISSNLQESAAREALETERGIADRKRKEHEALKSKEPSRSKTEFASKSKERPGLSDGSQGPPPPVSDRTKEKVPSDPGSRSLTKSGTTREAPKDRNVKSASWAGDPWDRQIKTVSGEEEKEVREVAEPLLDAPRNREKVSGLFDEDSPKGKTDAKSGKTAGSPDSKVAQNRPNKASFDGSHEHPWAEKSPVTNRAAGTSSQTQQLRPSQQLRSTEKETAKKNPETIPHTNRLASTGTHGQSSSKSADQQSAQQVEAKARVKSLLTQSKSMMRKGSYRSAYRVAQMAQQIADSENLFFAAGEEQPAEIVRTVLMKIRMEEGAEKGSEKESAFAANSDSSAGDDPWKPLTPKTTKSSVAQISKQPDDWAASDWHPEADRATLNAKSKSSEAPIRAVSSNSPWSKGELKGEKTSKTQNLPDEATRTEFPASRPEWKGTANAPLKLNGLAESETDAPEVRQTSRVVQADMNSRVAEGLPSAPDPTGAERSNALSARNWASDRKKVDTGELALANDWRTQDLADVGTSRSPLLVAPLPPASNITNTATEAMDDSLGIDVQEPTQPPQESKLWMMLAAAAGAFAMLFVRRRPAPVARVIVEGK